MTSRHNLVFNFNNFNDNFSAYEIQPLGADVILKFLEKTGLSVIDNWEKLLSNPMMLTLYANTCAIQKNTEPDKLFSFKPSNGSGEIIYNYLLCQLAKLLPNEQIENLYSAYIALFCVAPYIAWRMETENSLFIEDKNYNCVIKEYLSKNESIIQDRADEFLKVAALKYRCVRKSALEPRDVLTYLFHILEEQIFEDGELRFSFTHQHFRDFLAALHIINVIEDALLKEPFILPSEVTDYSWSVYVRAMIANYCGDYHHSESYDPKKPTLLHKLLGKLRHISACEYGRAIHNIIETWRDARGGRIIGEDLTSLDLGQIQMNGIWFSGYNAASVFDGSYISDFTFLPQGHSGHVNTAVYSPDGQKVLSSSLDETFKEWDIETGQCLCTSEGHSGRVAIYSTDGRRVLSVSGYRVIEWDWETGQFMHIFDVYPYKVISAVYSQDEERVLSAFWEDIIKEWDKETGQCLQTFEGHLNSVESVVYSPDGKRVLSASNDATIKEWDRKTGQCLRTFEGHSDYVISAVYSQDGERVLSASYDNTIKEWDRETGQCLRTFEGHSGFVNSAVYSMDERKVLSASKDNTIKEWDRETGQCLQTFKGYTRSIKNMVYSPDGRKVLFVSDDNIIYEWDRETGQCLRTFEGYSGSIKNAVYSPDGRKVLFVSYDNIINEWDIETGRCLRTFEGHPDPVNSKVYNLDGRGVSLRHSLDGTLKERNLETGEYLQTYKWHSRPIGKAIFSPDGQRVLSAYDDKTIKEWDRETGRCIRTFNGHSDKIYGVIYSPDGQKILSVSGDNTIKEWDRKKGKCILTIPLYGGIFITGCSFKDCMFSSKELKKLIKTYGGKLI